MEAFCHAAPKCGLSATLATGNGSAQGDLLTERDLAREPVKEPAKRWRNWWVATTTTTGRCSACGFVSRPKLPGEVYSAHCAWPSKDVAESRAEFAINTRKTRAKYLGAYPEGERP